MLPLSRRRLRTPTFLFAAVASAAAGGKVSAPQQLSEAHLESCGCAEADGPAPPEERQVPVDAEVSLAVRTAGDAAGPLYLFLHGFPSGKEYFWPVARMIMARHQGQGGTAARVILPDLRGFNDSSAPANDSAYEYWTMVDDVRAVLEAAAPGRPAHVVAHDIGGELAWGLASRHPHLIATLHVIGAAHPAVLEELLRKSAEQRYRSKYIRMLSDEAFLGSLERCGAEDGDGDGGTSDLFCEAARATLGAPLGSIRGMTGAYRANCRPLASDLVDLSCHALGEPVGHVDVPTHVLWGTADPYFDNEAVLDRLPDVASDLHVQRVEFEGHDLPHTDPCFVAAAVSAFVQGTGAAAAAGATTPPSPSPPGSGAAARAGGVLHRVAGPWVSDPAVVCGDGQPATYYFRLSATSQNWLVYYEGGGACTTTEMCEMWRQNFTHLSGPGDGPAAFPETLPASGLLSADSCENPAFHDYNMAYVPYCSGDLYAMDHGSIRGSFQTRGHRIFRAVLEHVATRFSIGTRLIVAGSSAGGIGIQQHAAWAWESLRNRVRSLGFLLDSAWAVPEGMGELSFRDPALAAALPGGEQSPCFQTWGTPSIPCCLSPQCMALRYDFPPNETSAMYLVAQRDLVLGARVLEASFSLDLVKEYRMATLSSVRSTSDLVWRPREKDVTAYVVDDAAHIYLNVVLWNQRAAAVRPDMWENDRAWKAVNPRSILRYVTVTGQPPMIDVIVAWAGRLGADRQATPTIYAEDPVSCAAVPRFFCSQGAAMRPPRAHGDVVQPSLSQLHEAADEWAANFSASVWIASRTVLLSAGLGDFAEASRRASLLAARERAAAAIYSVPEGAQACLYGTDREIAGLRAAIAGAGYEGIIAALLPTATLEIPGVGSYTGIPAIVEYTNISNNPDVNDNFQVTLQTMVGLEIDPADSDSVLITEEKIFAWENFTRASSPTIWSRITFRPCSAQIAHWKMTFSVETGIDYFTSGAYSNKRLCALVQLHCTGDLTQFASEDECVTFYDALPPTDSACRAADSNVAYSLQGNTTRCRFLHHFMMKITPAAHCPHVGRGMRDPTGKIKCSSADCVVKKEPLPVSSPGDKEEAVGCAVEAQADVEMRLVAVLPPCLGALRVGVCTDKCRQALRQMGLVGHGAASEARRLAVCACRVLIGEAPLSAVLAVSGVNALAALEVCAAANCSDGAASAALASCSAGEVAASTGAGGGCLHAVALETIAPAAVRLIADRSAAAAAGAREGAVATVQAEEVRRVDEDVLFALTGGTNIVEMAGAFAWGVDTITWHGDSTLAVSHREVLRIMQRLDQLRTPSASARQSDMLHGMMSPHLPQCHSTGTVGHAAARAATYSAFPMLASDAAIVLEPPAELALGMDLFAGSSGTALADAGTAPADAFPRALVEYAMVTFWEQMLPGGENFTDIERAAMAVVFRLREATFQSLAMHRTEGYARADGIRKARESLANYIENYFGPREMARLTQMQNISERDGANMMADGMRITGSGIVLLFAETLSRIMRAPCLEMRRFAAAPELYIIETARLRPPVNWGATLARAPPESAGSKGTVHISIFGANNDPRVFQDHQVFNPDRSDRLRALTWNALEADVHAGHGPTLARACPARNFSIKLTQALIESVLPSMDVLDVICYELRGTAWLDAQVVLILVVSGVLAAGLAFVIACSWARRRDLRRYVRGHRRAAKPAVEPASAEGGPRGGNVVLLRVTKASAYVARSGCQLLKEATLTLHAGEVMAIMGPSGSGKSTLMKLCSMRVDSNVRVHGSVLFKDNPVNTPRSVQNFLGQVGYVPQDVELCFLPSLTVAENLFCRAKMCAVVPFRQELMRSVDEAMRDFDLWHAADTRAGYLSGGQKKRLAMAMECLREAPVLFVDEPTSGLDASSSLLLMRFLSLLARGGARKTQRSVVVTVHQPRHEVFALFDQVTIVAKGRVLRSGPAQEVVRAFTRRSTEGGEEAGNVGVTGGEEASGGAMAADAVLDNLARMTTHQILSMGDIVCESAEPRDCSSPARPSSPASQHVMDWKRRLDGLMLARLWSQDLGMIATLLLVLPVVFFCVAGLPNISAGGLPEQPELMSQVIVLSTLPLFVAAGWWGTDIASWCRRLVFLLRGRAVSWSEAVLELLIWYVGMTVLATSPWASAALAGGFSGYVTAHMLLRVLAVVISSSAVVLLLILNGNVAVVQDSMSQEDACTVSMKVMAATVSYCGFGITFSGLFYRANAIPEIWSMVSFLSVGFWSFCSVLVLILNDLKLACAGSGCPSAAMLLHGLGLSKRLYIPAGAVGVLLVGDVLLGLLLVALVRRRVRTPHISDTAPGGALKAGDEEHDLHTDASVTLAFLGLSAQAYRSVASVILESAAMAIEGTETLVFDVGQSVAAAIGLGGYEGEDANAKGDAAHEPGKTVVTRAKTTADAETQTEAFERVKPLDHHSPVTFTDL